MLILSFCYLLKIEKSSGENKYKSKTEYRMFKNLVEKNYLQLMLFGIVLLLSSLILMGLAYLVGVAIWSESDVTLALSGFLDNTRQINILKMFQIMNQLSMFIIPPLTLYFLIRKTRPNYLNINKLPDISIFFAIIVLFVFTLPIIQSTMLLNQKMVFPDSLKFIEDWMREKEDLAATLTTKFLNVNTSSAFVFNLIMMALIPAIGEELVFRGLLMRWLSKPISNIHINILITAFLFSAIHMQFFGFIPRFFLGIILGYLYYWTKSLWAPIWLHFINNATTVTIFFWVHKTQSNINPEDVGNVEGYGYLIIAIVITAAIMNWIYKRRITEGEIG